MDPSMCVSKELVAILGGAERAKKLLELSGVVEGANYRPNKCIRLLVDEKYSEYEKAGKLKSSSNG